MGDAPQPGGEQRPSGGAFQAFFTFPGVRRWGRSGEQQPGLGKGDFFGGRE